MKNSQLLEICLRLIEEKFGEGSYTEWTKRYYIQLAEDISECSKINISYNTIIRLYERIGKTEEGYAPHKATLDALAIYLGYSDWKAFSIDKQDKKPVIKVNKEKITGLLSRLKKVLVFGLIFMLSVILFYFIHHYYSKEIIVFETKGSVSQGVPHTATFYIDLTQTKYDSAFIHFDNWESPHLLEKKKDTLTGFYLKPGYYHPKLIANNKQLAHAPVHVVSNNWYYRVKSDRANKYSDYRVFDSTNKLLYLPLSKIHELGFDTNTQFNVEYFMAKEWEVNMDEMSMLWRFRNSGNRPCKDSYIMLEGERGMILLRFYAKGCSRLVEIIIGDIMISGKKENHEAFTTDIENWQDVLLSISNKQALIHLKGKEIFNTSYSSLIGQLKYIFVGFSGSGMVDKIEIESNEMIVPIF
jgi:hypothetical protein